MAVTVPVWMRRFSFGSGAAMEWVGDSLRISVTRLRGGQASLAGEAVLDGAKARPASAWGADAQALLKRLGCEGQPVTLVLDWRECATRTLRLPGVAARDLAAAVELELDGLSPYGEETVSAWMALDGFPAVLAAFARRAVISEQAARFAEAGLPLGAITVPAAVIYRARRAGPVDAPGAVLAFLPERPEQEGGGCAVYGESESSPVFWAPVPERSPRALAMAQAQMRLPDADAVELNAVLPVETLSAAGAIAASRWGAAGLNLLPAAERVVRRPWALVPAMALAAMLAVLLAALAGFDAYRDRALMNALQTEIQRQMPQAQRAREAERAAAAAMARVEELQRFRARTRKDLDALQEATRLVAAPGWAQQLDLTRTMILVTGESEQAADLLKLFDNSALFRNTEFLGPLSRQQNSRGDQFRLRAERKDP
jgi:hypothetical protein